MKDQSTSGKKSKTAEEKIHTLIFEKCLQECVTKLSIDECYPEEIMNEFKAYSFVYDDVLNICALIRDVIAAFNGDLNKFYPKFYQAFADAEASFKGLCRTGSLLLGFELTNHVLAYLSAMPQLEQSSLQPSTDLHHRHLLQTTSYNHLLLLHLLISRKGKLKQQQARNPP